MLISTCKRTFGTTVMGGKRTLWSRILPRLKGGTVNFWESRFVVHRYRVSYLSVCRNYAQRRPFLQRRVAVDAKPEGIHLHPPIKFWITRGPHEYRFAHQLVR